MNPTIQKHKDKYKQTIQGLRYLVYVCMVNMYGEKTISYQGRTSWNTLPNDLKENMSGSQFKNKLKLHFLNNY